MAYLMNIIGSELIDDPNYNRNLEYFASVQSELDEPESK